MIARVPMGGSFFAPKRELDNAADDQLGLAQTTFWKAITTLSHLRPVEIGIIIYPGAQMASVLGMTDLLAFADRQAQQDNRLNCSRLRVSHWQREDGALRRVFESFPASGEPAVLLLPPTLGDPPTQEIAAPYADFLRARYAAGVALGSICAGAFVLAETELLTHRVATTHWAYAEAFRQRFPQVRLEADHLLVDDGDILTAGGVMAWTDLCLRLIERFLGPAVMLGAARSFLIDPPGREQRYYSGFSPRLDHDDGAILKVQQWLHATAAKDIRLFRLAEVGGVGKRTFLRRFQKATGLTSVEYCQRLRVASAQDLVRANLLSIDQVAWEVGYSDIASFRKVFTKIVGLTPGEYRQRFRGR